MGDTERLQWMALGFALANPIILQRIREMDQYCFDAGIRRDFWRSLSDKDKVLQSLGRIGVPCPQDKKCFDAILDLLKDYGKEQRQKWIGEHTATAARTLTPGQFLEFLEKQIADCSATFGPRKEPAGNGESAVVG